MPFKSEAQRRYMWKFHPGIARRWAHEGPNKGLPKHAAGKKTTRPRKRTKGGRGKRLQ